MTPRNVNVDAKEALVLAALAEHMSKMLIAYREFGRTEKRWTVTEDSPANVDRQDLGRQFGPGECWDGYAADYCADAAYLLLFAQADHLAVLHSIYSNYAGLIFGAGPPARSLLEINGYVFWLLHPDLDSVRTRGARALLARMNNAAREISAAQAMGAPMRVVSRLGELRRDLKASVARQFWPSEIRRDKHGNLFLRDERHPGPGEALRHLRIAGGTDWNSRGAYAFLSNAAHPTLHVVTDTLLPQGDGSIRVGHRDAVYHYRLARMALAGFASTWQITAAYRGLDQGTPCRLMQEIENLPDPG